MITKEEILEIYNYFETQIEFSGDDTYFSKKEAQYVLDLITRDWKMQGKMRKPYQVRNEMEHQKKLLSNEEKLPWEDQTNYLLRTYRTRVFFASWVLGDSDTF